MTTPETFAFLLCANCDPYYAIASHCAPLQYYRNIQNDVARQQRHFKWWRHFSLFIVTLKLEIVLSTVEFKMSSGFAECIEYHTTL